MLRLSNQVELVSALGHHVVRSTLCETSSHCSLSMAFHANSHKHFLSICCSHWLPSFVLVLSRRATFCLASLHRVAVFRFYSGTHENQVVDASQSNHAEESKKGRVNGSQLEGKMMVMRVKAFICRSSFNQKQMDGWVKSLFEKGRRLG